MRRALSGYTQGTYVNFAGLDLGSRSTGNFEYMSMYYGENVARLRAIKRTCGPEELFQFGQSIPPAG